MSNYDEEYDEYFELDNVPEVNNLLEQLGDVLKGQVRSDVLTELKELRAENERLRDIANNVESLQREAQWAKHDALSQARRETLKELMGEFNETYWGIDYDSIEKPKCDLCDDKRMLRHTFPNGVVAGTSCKCAEKQTVYKPVEVQIAKIVMENYRHSPYLYMEYRGRYNEKGSENLRVESVRRENIYDSKPDFENIDRISRAIFTTRELAQEFCDWKNKRSEESEE